MHPEPGPPWTTSAGFPSGWPHVVPVMYSLDDAGALDGADQLDEAPGALLAGLLALAYFGNLRPADSGSVLERAREANLTCEQ